MSCCKNSRRGGDLLDENEDVPGEVVDVFDSSPGVVLET